MKEMVLANTPISPAQSEDVQTLAAEAVQEVEPILKHARDMQVVDEVSYAIAMAGVARCKHGQDRVEKLFGLSRDLAHKTHKAITDAIGSIVRPLKQAADIYGGKAYAWKKQEDARLAAEELARQQRERATKTDEKLNVASFLDAAGAHAEAEQVLAEPVVVVPQEVKGPAAPAGTGTKENWQWECTDLAALVKAAAAGEVPLSMVTTADTVITKMVKALKAETRLPGIRVWDKGSVSVERKS